MTSWTFWAFLGLVTIVRADVYDNCGANNANCFGIALFESDLETCIAQRVTKDFRPMFFPKKRSKNLSLFLRTAKSLRPLTELEMELGSSLKQPTKVLMMEAIGLELDSPRTEVGPWETMLLWHAMEQQQQITGTHLFPTSSVFH